MAGPAVGLGHKLVNIVVGVGLGEPMLWSDELLDGEDSVQVLDGWLPPTGVDNLVIRVNGL